MSFSRNDSGQFVRLVQSGVVASSRVSLSGVRAFNMGPLTHARVIATPLRPPEAQLVIKSFNPS